MKKPHLPMAREGNPIQAPLPAWALNAANPTSMQIVTVGATSNATGSVVVQSCVILTSTVNCWVKWSPGSAAAVAAVANTAGNMYLAAGIPRAMGNWIGWYSVIQDSTGGFLVVEPCFED